MLHLISQLAFPLLLSVPQPTNGGPGGVTWTGERAVQKTATTERAIAVLGVDEVGEHVEYVVSITDRRPYGDVRSLAHLVHCPKTQITLDEQTKLLLDLSLVFTPDGRDLLCAFTAVGASPPPETSSAAIEAREALWRHYSPAHSSELESSIADVLAAAWRYHHIDPREATQVVIRPRWVENDAPQDASTGAPIFPPANVWIVEVLGFAVQWPGAGHPRTIILHIRDGDLEHLWGDVLY